MDEHEEKTPGLLLTLLLSLHFLCKRVKSCVMHIFDHAPGSSINHVVKILGIFDPPSPFVITWSNGHLANPPSPLNCPRGL